MIELREISRVFEVGGRPVRALDGLDLEIAPGDYIAVMGPSGSGKSTLLNILGCLDRPTAGSYRLEGKEVATLDEAALASVRRHKIGFVFQAFHLVPRLTAAANVELPMVFAGVERPERAARVARALESVGLSERAHHRPEQLSGGERQRVAIARSVVMEPSLLLADEPTGNLDRASGDEVIGLLERMNRDGLTLVVVTHDPDIGRRARRIVRLVDGAHAPEGDQAGEPVPDRDRPA
jgi:putative ABC transport system ATP-binding protein